MSYPTRVLLAFSVAAPALIAAGLYGGGSPGSAIEATTQAQGPLTCHEGFCQGSTGSDDMFWPWIVQPWIQHFPTGSASFT
ncbi:hypothetical protein ACFXPS_41860 [Nocardia sp. NPDC059091]|uniref:hypothetical protein n=1 Tax=unclassified Nocardia TaxID=2637762 RepID=UPI00369D2BDF